MKTGRTLEHSATRIGRGGSRSHEPARSRRKPVRPRRAPAALSGALARAQRGELGAFRELIRAYQDTVYSLALRMLKVPEDAEELAQDVFICAHRHLGRISSEAHLLFWLRRTVCHRAIDRLRRRPAFPPVPLDDAAEPATADSGADPLLERCLRDLVLRLLPMPRVVVLLKGGSGFRGSASP